MYTERRQRDPKPLLPAESEKVKPFEDTELLLVLFLTLMHICLCYKLAEGSNSRDPVARNRSVITDAGFSLSMVSGEFNTHCVCRSL